MSRQIHINYDAVASTVSDITGKTDSSSLAADYDTLIATLSESKGDTAKALKSALKGEQALVKQIGTTMRQLAQNIQSATDEFKSKDSSISGAMR